MTAIFRVPIISTLIIFIGACVEEPNAPDGTTLGKDTPGDWSQVQIDEYETCLQDSMAQATAWEVIEQQCKDTVNGDDLVLPE